MSDAVYTRLRFLRGRKRLLRELDDSEGEWLGIDERGRFVFGYPRRSGVMSVSASLSVTRAGLPDPSHYVKVTTADGDSTEPVATEDEARRHFHERVNETRQSASGVPGIVTVERLREQKVVDREVVFRNISVAVEEFLDAQSLTFLGVLSGVVLAIALPVGVTQGVWWGLLSAVATFGLVVFLLRAPKSKRLLIRFSDWVLRHR